MSEEKPKPIKCDFDMFTRISQKKAQPDPPESIFQWPDQTWGWLDETWNPGDDIHYVTRDEAVAAQNKYCTEVLGI